MRSGSLATSKGDRSAQSRPPTAAPRCLPSPLPLARVCAAAQCRFTTARKDRAPPYELTKGIAWFGLAAQQGHVEAMFQLAKSCSELALRDASLMTKQTRLSKKPLDINLPRALYWYKQAAQQGHTLAAVVLPNFQAMCSQLENAAAHMSKEAGLGNITCNDVALLMAIHDGPSIPPALGAHRKWAEGHLKLQLGAKACAGCGVEEDVAKLSTCARCKSVHYCCKQHQKAHWRSTHKTECEALAALRAYSAATPGPRPQLGAPP